MPEGDLLLAALDGRNECVEGTLGSLDEDVEEGGNELEHNVLLTIGKRRTRGYLVRLRHYTTFSEALIFSTQKPPLMGVAKRPYLHFQRSPNDHALSTFSSTDKQGHR